MALIGYISEKLLVLTAATAIFSAPFSIAHASYQDDDVEKNKPSDQIELIEEKAPRTSKSTPQSLLVPKKFMPFDESPNAQQDGFFYLTDNDKKGLSINLSPTSASALTLDSMLKRQTNISLNLNGLDIFSTEGAIDFTVADGDSLDPALDGFALSLKSAINLGMPELAISPESVGMENPLLERHYNLGISLGYSGFNLDASIREKDGGTSNVYSGIDVGFSYRTQKWMTRVGLSEYTYARSPYSILPDTIKRLYSLEVGGAYNLSPWMSLSGGLKVIDYNKGYGVNDPRRSGQVYLGGRLSY